MNVGSEHYPMHLCPPSATTAPMLNVSHEFSHKWESISYQCMLNLFSYSLLDSQIVCCTWVYVWVSNWLIQSVSQSVSKSIYMHAYSCQHCYRGHNLHILLVLYIHCNTVCHGNVIYVFPTGSWRTVYCDLWWNLKCPANVVDNVCWIRAIPYACMFPLRYHPCWMCLMNSLINGRVFHMSVHGEYRIFEKWLLSNLEPQLSPW